MTHADEAEFIQLWNQGASYKAIAQAQRCPLGTVASRAAALVAQGKITSRPRGGRRAKAQPDDSPAPARPPAPPPAITFMAVPKVRELIHTVQTASEHCLRQCAMKPTVLDQCNPLNVYMLALSL